MEQIIQVEHLTKEYKTPKKYPGLKGTIKSLFSTETVIKRAVTDMNFTVNKGEILGYIGSNGAGKSTTIKMMTGILVPTSGRCLVNGVEPYKHRKENSRRIGVVFGQRTQLWWDLPLTESFTVLKEIYQLSDQDFKKRMDFIHDILDIHEFQNSAVRTLSLGQRMRADLGAALIHNPDILYLDEPTIGLDVIVKDKIRQAIKEMTRNYNTTVILTTHDLVDIEQLCNHIILIDDSRKIYDGSLNGLKSEFGSMTVLEMDVEQSSTVRDLKLNSYFGLSEEMLSSQMTDKTLRISFNKEVISVSKIAGYIMGLTDIVDFRVKETDLTEIVKKIYSKGEKGI